LFNLFLGFLDPNFGLLEVRREFWMSSFLASFAIWTEAGHPETTYLVLFVMLQSAVRPKRAKPAIIMRTRRSLGLGVDVKIQAIISVGAR
jgi:hypothetical protein